MADFKKFLDQGGVTTLWSRISTKLEEEKSRAIAAEEAAAAAAKKAQDEVDALEAYVGTIPTEGYADVTNIVAFIQKRAQEVLTAAQGGSSETAASVAAALEAYKSLNDPKVTKNAEDIAAIMEDYLKKADKDELAEDISENAAEIVKINAALAAALENDGEGLDSIKELAAWIEEHGTEAAGYSAAISALKALVGDTAVAAQIEAAIAAENLAQYATDEELAALTGKVDTKGTVTEAINAAIGALAIGDYAKAADLTALAARVTALENAGHLNEAQVNDAINAAIAALKLADTYETKGAAATAEANAKAYADSLASNYDAAGTAAAAEAAAKAYTDSEIARRVIPLTEAEIDAAIANASAQV